MRKNRTQVTSLLNNARRLLAMQVKPKAWPESLQTCTTAYRSPAEHRPTGTACPSRRRQHRHDDHGAPRIDIHSAGLPGGMLSSPTAEDKQEHLRFDAEKKRGEQAECKHRTFFFFRFFFFDQRSSGRRVRFRSHRSDRQRRRLA